MRGPIPGDQAYVLVPAMNRAHAPHQKIGPMPLLPKVTIGLDLGDRTSVYAILNADGQVVARGQVPTPHI